MENNAYIEEFEFHSEQGEQDGRRERRWKENVFDSCSLLPAIYNDLVVQAEF